jgi:hypothetical protein
MTPWGGSRKVGTMRPGVDTGDALKKATVFRHGVVDAGRDEDALAQKSER